MKIKQSLIAKRDAEIAALIRGKIDEIKNANSNTYTDRGCIIGLQMALYFVDPEPHK